jgi:hypothetical protein
MGGPNCPAHEDSAQSRDHLCRLTSRTATARWRGWAALVRGRGRNADRVVRRGRNRFYDSRTGRGTIIVTFDPVRRSRRRGRVARDERGSVL